MHIGSTDCWQSKQTNIMQMSGGLCSVMGSNLYHCNSNQGLNSTESFSDELQLQPSELSDMLKLVNEAAVPLEDVFNTFEFVRDCLEG